MNQSASMVHQGDGIDQSMELLEVIFQTANQIPEGNTI